jgi:hypothetical protein
MLRLHTGDALGARALADTLKADHPSHLFGLLITGTLARWERNDAALDAAQREFLRRYEAEIAANRPEYGDHKVALERFLSEARANPRLKPNPAP